MLYKPDVETKKMLDLADFIEKLEPDRFDMSKWGDFQEPRCICGWLQHNDSHMDKDDWPEAGRRLGLEREMAHTLFHSTGWTQRDAVAALRHLAVTGELP